MTRHASTPGPARRVSSPQPARQQAVQRDAERLGRRHGKAAVYWQIGGNGTQDFWRHLLLAAADGAPQDLYEMPELAPGQDYDRDRLAAALGLAPGAPALAGAAQAYQAAAREEFWLEAARLARRHLQPRSRPAGQSGAAQDITDPATGLSRLLTERCSTCILRPGDRMHLGPEHTARFVRHALAEGTYVICHQTLTNGDHPDFGPAICRGFFDAYAARSRALVLLRAFRRLTEVGPPRPGGPPEEENR